MELTVIGSGTVAPTSERVAPSHWLDAPPARVLFDCGAGMLHRAAALGIPWHTATHVVLTHFHPDHWAELPSYLFALRWGIEPPRAAPLTLIGPAGLLARLTMLAGAFGQWILDPEYPLSVTEVGPEEEHPLADGIVLQTCATPHTTHSLAYAVRTASARFVYTGDTGVSEALGRFAGGCDLLLAECSLPDERAIPLHLTPTQAGELAEAAGVHRLVLTHFYPVFGAGDPARVAATRFGGEVTAAQDGDRFSIGV